MSDPVLQLSTQVEPALTFTVDDEVYELLGFKHLNSAQEAEVMGLLARFDHLSVQLATTGDDKEAVSLARKLRDKRSLLLQKLTTLTPEVIEKLPLPEQVKLIQTVQKHAGLNDGDDEA